MLWTTRLRRKPRVRSGSKVDHRDEIERKILDWLEHPDAELECYGLGKLGTWIVRLK
jgi:hypothetical protein